MPQEPENLLLGCQEGLVRIIHRPGSAGRESSFPKVEIGPSHQDTSKDSFGYQIRLKVYQTGQNLGSLPPLISNGTDF